MPAISERGDDFKPLVVEFAGSPKRAKAQPLTPSPTFLNAPDSRMVADRRRQQANAVPIAPRLGGINAWALNYAVSEILVACHSAEPCDLVILDRGPFDSLAWMRLLRDRNELSDDEYDRFERFARHPKWAGIGLRLYLFTVPLKHPCSASINTHLSKVKAPR